MSGPGQVLVRSRLRANTARICTPLPDPGGGVLRETGGPGGAPYGTGPARPGLVAHRPAHARTARWHIAGHTPGPPGGAPYGTHGPAPAPAPAAHRTAPQNTRPHGPTAAGRTAPPRQPTRLPRPDGVRMKQPGPVPYVRDRAGLFPGVQRPLTRAIRPTTKGVKSAWITRAALRPTREC
ncbi:hypothetical protein Snoj_14530 [Streptomyces nojiriensis]|uniref:Uncharacterized protein n=1 Tax=Streptomyces nojiriensis TaxID=66374 RepID=A0ABQ3SHA8_9ACTN|nr:hypothetical protein GCM10010205_45500 [Streptomyces nojiriensis]GHI67535.1 hypothetical protein Snoj_14530 [Streptomyces nojiriensis]